MFEKKEKKKGYDPSSDLELLVSRYPALKVSLKDIEKAFHMISDSFEGGGKLLVCGNGGSAADSLHIVGELMKSFKGKRPLNEKQKAELMKVDKKAGALIGEGLQRTLPAVSLVNEVSLISAFANDVEPSLNFAQQLLGLGKKGDVLLAISTSGNSENVVYAAITARALGLKVVALTGSSGGRLADFSDVTIGVPAEDVADVQELHLPVYHTLCSMLEGQFFD